MTKNESLKRIIEVTRARKTGKGWLGHCPAHGDRNPSFSINEGRDGLPLVRCHSGCSQSDVVQALKELDAWYGSARGGH